MRSAQFLFASLAIAALVGAGCEEERVSSISTPELDMTFTEPVVVDVDGNITQVYNGESADPEDMGEYQYVIEIRSGDAVHSDEVIRARYAYPFQPIELAGSDVLYSAELKMPTNGYTQSSSYLRTKDDGSRVLITSYAMTATGIAAATQQLVTTVWK